MNPLRLIREAIRAVPAVKYALGVAGIAAVVAIALGLKLSPQFAVFGTLIVLGLMFILVLFVKFASLKAGGPGPVNVLVWFYTITVMVVTSLFISSYFWHVPHYPFGNGSRGQIVITSGHSGDDPTSNDASKTKVNSVAPAPDRSAAPDPKPVNLPTQPIPSIPSGQTGQLGSVDDSKIDINGYWNSDTYPVEYSLDIEVLPNNHVSGTIIANGHIYAQNTQVSKTIFRVYDLYSSWDGIKLMLSGNVPGTDTADASINISLERSGQELHGSIMRGNGQTTYGVFKKSQR